MTFSLLLKSAATGIAQRLRGFGLACILASSAVPLAQAQDVALEVAGSAGAQIPIAVPAIVGDSAAGEDRINEIVLANLERSGALRRVPATGLGMSEQQEPDYPLWKEKGADALAAGSLSSTGRGLDLRFKLWDVVTGKELLAQTISVESGQQRYAAHRMADAIYQALTGQKGAFASRVAYITKSGGRSNPNYTLWVADSDGENAHAVLTSREPIISPAWSPRGDELAYVSFEARKPVVYIHSVATGARRIVASFKGNNSAPSWSPDGQFLLVSLSRDGGTQIFRISRSGGQALRLSQGGSINTEAVYSPDGRNIYFVSDRGGAPQIYRMSAQGGAAERVSFGSAQSISPAISPDGRSLAYIARENGGFRLRLLDLHTGQSRLLTNTTEDERPSFAPNGRMIVYATRAGGQELLMNTSLDGRVKTRLLTRRGDIREPSWGK